ncbi:MAG: hypothetical protein C0609_04020, partial [Deltaproteobacteria bacterium]
SEEEPSEEEPSEEEPSEEESSAEEAAAEELFEEEPQAGSEEEPATFDESASVSEDEDKRLEDKFLSLTLAEEGETEDEGEDLVSGPSGEAGAIELPVVEEELPPAEETIPEPEAVSFIEDSVTEEELILEETADGSGDLSLEVGEATDEATGREPDSFELEETFRALTGAAEAGLTQDDEIKPLTPEEEVEAADALATELVESTEDDIFTALDDALDVFDEDDSVASERASSDDAPAPVDEFDLGIEFAEGEELFTEPVKASEDIEGEAVDMPAPFPDDDPFAAELALEFHDSTHRELIDFSFDRAESEVGIYAAALAPDFEKLKRDESLPEVDSLHPASETQSIIPELDIDDSWAIASEDDDSFDLDIDSYFEKFERED